MSRHLEHSARGGGQQLRAPGQTTRATESKASIERQFKTQAAVSNDWKPPHGVLQYVLSLLKPGGPERVSSRQIRTIILEESFRAKVGHIGSALSVADILAALYGKVLRLGSTDDPERDRFVLSKGHAALALYAALYLRGWISKAELNGFCGDGSLLGVHPEFEQRGVDFTTGSLGQGLSMSVGAALAARWQNSSRRVFVLLSDAECNEGSVWEAAMLASHHQLANLVAIIDVNGQQALDYTKRVVDMHPLEERWKSFGWDARTIDGHNTAQLANVMEGLDTRHGAPHVLLATTMSGKGVSFMENRIEWHYLPMSAEQYSRALQEVQESL